MCVCVYTRVLAKSLQSCPTPCNPIDCSLPGFSAYGILQLRILEWFATPGDHSSRRSFQPKNQTHASFLMHWQEDSLSLVPPGKHIYIYTNSYIPNYMWVLGTWGLIKVGETFIKLSVPRIIWVQISIPFPHFVWEMHYEYSAIKVSVSLLTYTERFDC